MKLFSSSIFKENIPAEFYYQQNQTEIQKIDIPVYQKGKNTIIPLLTKQIGTQDWIPCIKIKFPKWLNSEFSQVNLKLRVFNHDRIYLRAIYFDIDSLGGMIGTHRLNSSQVRGIGTVGRLRRKTLNFNLDRCEIADKTKGSNFISYNEIIRSPEEHIFRSWITAKKKEGPKSWVSITLNFSN